MVDWRSRDVTGCSAAAAESDPDRLTVAVRCAGRAECLTRHSLSTSPSVYHTTTATRTEPSNHQCYHYEVSPSRDVTLLARPAVLPPVQNLPTTSATITRCRPHGTQHYWPALQCYRGAIIRLKTAWRHRLAAWVKLPAGLPWSVTDTDRRRQQTTDDDDRRQRVKQYWPRTLCAGGPVITRSFYDTTSLFAKLLKHGQYSFTSQLK